MGLVVFLLLIACIAGPSLWVKYVLKKYSATLEGAPGTGGELARHLIDKYQLVGVSVEQTEPWSDHYDPAEKKVRLSPAVYAGKSLTAIAVAAHEVGHALQYARNDKITRLREAWAPLTVQVQRLGTAVIMLAPIVLAVFHVPHAALLTAVMGVLTMLVGACMQLIVLPMEWDASFNKALPILVKGQYVPEVYQSRIRTILTAAALTYFAAALIQVLQLWRWLAVLRGVIR